MHKMYHYHILAEFPSVEAIDIIQQNAKENGWISPADGEHVWQLCLGQFHVRWCTGKWFEASEAYPSGIVTTKPVLANSPDTNLEELMCYFLKLFKGVYIEELKAERLTIEEWNKLYTLQEK